MKSKKIAVALNPKKRWAILSDAGKSPDLSKGKATTMRMTIEITPLITGNSLNRLTIKKTAEKNRLR